MKPNTIALSLAGATICVSLVASLRWQHATAPTPTDRPAIRSLAHAAATVADSALADAEDLVATNDPFRLSNAAPSMRFDPETESGASSVGSAPPLIRPTLVLKAIVGGPPWQAVIDGIPGQPPGTMARPGTRFDKLTVRSVTRDSVVIHGPDTAWVLTFRGHS